MEDRDVVSQLRPRDQAGTGRALHRVHHSLLTGDFALEIFKNGIICLPNHKKIENQNNYHNFSEADSPLQGEEDRPSPDWFASSTRLRPVSLSSPSLSVLSLRTEAMASAED